jgi:hypothetical protein
MELGVEARLASFEHLAAMEKCSRSSGCRLSDLAPTILDQEKAARYILNRSGEPITEIPAEEATC